MSAQAGSAWVLLSCVVPRADGVGIEKRAWSHLAAMAALRPPRLVLALTPAQLAQAPDLAFLNELCSVVHVLPLDASARGRRLDNTAAFLAQRLLLWGRPRWQPRAGAVAALLQALGGARLGDVFCFRLACFELWRLLAAQHGLSAQRLVVDFDDIESLAQQRALAQDGALWGRAHRLAARLEIAEQRRLETLALRAHEVLVCSTVDDARLRERAPAARVAVVPNAYPVLPALPPRQPGDTLNLLFLGTLSYAPNIDAADHLVHTLLPAIRRAWPGPVRLQIVGRRPVPRVQALHRPPEVQVLPDVADITSAYAQADVVVVPIRFGGGTRIKILEALSLGRPVVTTALGVEGLDLQHERDLLVADAPDAFAQACVRIAGDAALAARLANQGRRSFLALYGDDIVRGRTQALLSRPLPSSTAP